MVKTATETRTRAAKKDSVDAPIKTKTARAPSAYNLFMKDRLKPYRDANPGTSNKDAMKAVAAQWRDAPENPNRGQDPKTRTKKAAAPKKTKKAAAAEEAATSEAEPVSDE